mmetsp:Transcript_28721/g.52478  ORF Transcript_28721/g.52478 Transcript_28721/m.52478 type:complete len:237 (+) Transcript_28721:381-1091(+)
MSPPPAVSARMGSGALPRGEARRGRGSPPSPNPSPDDDAGGIAVRQSRRQYVGRIGARLVVALLVAVVRSVFDGGRPSRRGITAPIPGPSAPAADIVRLLRRQVQSQIIHIQRYCRRETQPTDHVDVPDIRSASPRTRGESDVASVPDQHGQRQQRLAGIPHRQRRGVAFQRQPQLAASQLFGHHRETAHYHLGEAQQRAQHGGDDRYGRGGAVRTIEQVGIGTHGAHPLGDGERE